MRKQIITSCVLNKLEPNDKPYFIRDKSLTGFAVKVNPSGRLKFVSEVRQDGQLYRKTLGEYPMVDLQEAKSKAMEYMAQVRAGLIRDRNKRAIRSLQELFDAYVKEGKLKQRTITDYNEAVGYYLYDWLEKPVSSISKSLVEKRFYQIRDKGINGGRPIVFSACISILERTISLTENADAYGCYWLFPE